MTRLGCLLLLALIPARPASAQPFGTGQTVATLQSAVLNEVSGLAASRHQPGVLWAHNDSGGAAAVYAIGPDGALRGTYVLEGATNRDWEDLAIGPGPESDIDYLYIGEIGDNSAVYPAAAVYRVPEPRVPTSGPPVTATVALVDRLPFVYADGPRDAETLLLDPFTRDLYVVSKRETNVQLYAFPYPQDGSVTATLAVAATLPFTWIVGGDIAPSGTQIALKTMFAAYGWPRAPTQTVAAALAAPATALPHTLQPGYLQNEAMAWADWDAGYFTLAEGVGAPVVFHTNLAGVVEADIDADGMEDHWERHTFGGRSIAGPDTDNDMDGSPDRHEFIAGTDATDPGAYPRIADAATLPDGRLVVAWAAVPGRIYDLSAAVQPGQPFLPLLTAASGDAATLVRTTTVPAAPSALLRLDIRRDE